MNKLDTARHYEREAMLAKVAQHEWQPIDTAPRDGTMILATSYIHKNSYVVGWTLGIDVELEDHQEGCWTNVGNKNAAISLTFNPRFFTHWMPLPEPPATP